MKFAFIAKHKEVWPLSWLCSALGVSRSGFHAWLTRKPSQRTRDDERIGTMARASFLASDRTYGARRVWHDVLAHGVDCGLHKIELMGSVRGVGGNSGAGRSVGFGWPSDLAARVELRSSHP